MRTFPHPLSVLFLAVLLSALPGCEYPLYVPVSRGDLQRVRTLLDQGHRENIDPIFSGQVCEGHTEMAQLLLERGGANVNVANRDIKGFWGYSALQCAALKGNAEMVSLLLSHGDNPDYKGKPGMTARELAKKKGQAAIVRLLDDAQAATTATPPQPPAPAPSKAESPPPPIY
jgi:ankyrin repeat protein